MGDAAGTQRTFAPTLAADRAEEGKQNVTAQERDCCPVSRKTGALRRGEKTPPGQRAGKVDFIVPAGRASR
ncbi:hypothetical protein GCWU000246_00222 [Jonquetella anthropi E3_33 E1]|nr:hypothetical protein GCWU000246_00222 [Jonquetella anthropi E3_33 E1]